MSDVQRFALSARGDPTAEPGLERDAVGNVYVVLPDGSRQLLSGGGSQPGAVYKADVLFNEPDSYAITAVDMGTQSVGIAGDHTAEFAAGKTFNIVGSTGNDGTYTVDSVSFGAGATTIVTVEALSDATADGNVNRNRLDATLAIPAGATVLDMFVYPLVAPWADGAADLDVGDGTGADAWLDGVDLSSGGLSAAYDPTSIGNSNFVSSASGNGTYLDGSLFPGVSAAGARAGGVLYPAGDTLTLAVTRIDTGGGGAQTLVRVWIAAASTATVAD